MLSIIERDRESRNDDVEEVQATEFFKISSRYVKVTSIEKYYENFAMALLVP